MLYIIIIYIIIITNLCYHHCKASQYSREEINLFCPMFLDMMMFIFGVALVLYFLYK